MPAAAVIPAPIAYINVVAVKKLVVGSRWVGGGYPLGSTAPFAHRFDGGFRVPLIECPEMPSGLL